MEKLVLPIHFEDRSGTEFERLVFAYVTRLKEWEKLEWLGQTGSDKGRDIWGEIHGEMYCYQCANYRQLSFSKAKTDIDKLIQAKRTPHNLIVVCGGRVSADLRSKIENYVKSNIPKTAVWNAVEFEEKLRKDTPELIKRFVEGEPFPDNPKELVKFASTASIKTDSDIIDLIAECFDRPAFTTKFRDESSIPDFEKALKDTIEVLNTGVHRLRDGTTIRNIPSRHRIVDKTLKEKLSAINALVVKLRDNFVSLIRSNDIRPCGCGQVECPVYFLSDKASETMDKLRQDIFKALREIKPDLNIKIWT